MSENFELDVLETHRQDDQKVADGVKVFMSEDPEMPDGSGGSYVIVRPWQNKDFMTLMQSKTKKKMRQIEAGSISWEKTDAWMNEVVARTVMVGWGGPWFSRHGEPVEYTYELGLTIIQRVPCVKNDVEYAAKDEAQFRVDTIEETAGESPAPLSGSEDSALVAHSSNEDGAQV